jgi:hypothetical protein
MSITDQAILLIRIEKQRNSYPRIFAAGRLPVWFDVAAPDLVWS